MRVRNPPVILSTVEFWELCKKDIQLSHCASMIYTLHMLLYFRSFGKGHIKVIYASPSIHKENTNAETPNIKIRWTQQPQDQELLQVIFYKYLINYRINYSSSKWFQIVVFDCLYAFSSCWILFDCCLLACLLLWMPTDFLIIIGLPLALAYIAVVCSSANSPCVSVFHFPHF